MFLWICVFALPIVALATIVIRLWRTNRSELGWTSTYAAILFAFASPLVGLWGELHLDVLSRRSSLDYGFEIGGLAVSIVALVPTFIWFIRSRRWYSFAVFAISSIMSALWVVICGTF